MAHTTDSQPNKNDKYASLANTTMLFAISSFSAKLLNIFIRPFVTNVLKDPANVGVTTLTTQCANLLIPIVSMGIAYAIIRFGLDKRQDKTQVFTNGLCSIGLGYLILWLLFPLVNLVPEVSGYVGYLYIYVLTSCLRTLFANFVRSRQRNMIIAIDGVLCTLLTLFFYFLFLLVFELGATGYLLSIICADFFSCVYLFVSGTLWRYISFKNFNRKLWGEMLLFAIPMIPAQISFWVINTSDLFFVQILADGQGGFNGDHWVGLLSTAYYLPTILTTLGTIFYEAWQLSAVTEEEERRTFFGNIFRNYAGILCCISAGIIWLCQPLMTIFLDEFYLAWRFVPFLTVAAMFNCFNQFYNSIYVVYKHSMGSFLTMFCGAVVNCIMNFFFIQWWGVVGAALASMLGMMLVFVLRALHSRQFLPIDMAPRKLLLNVGLMMLQTAVLLLAVPNDWVYTTVITALVIVLNWGAVWSMGSMLLVRFLGKRGQAIVAKFQRGV